MSNFHAIGCELFDERNHLGKVIEILPVNDQVNGECDSMFPYCFRQFYFVGMGSCPGDPVRGVLSRVLETKLDVVEASVDQRRQPSRRKADTGGDEVGVKIRRMCAVNEFGQIGAGQRFAPGQMEVEDPEFSSLAKDAEPLLSGKL